MIVKLIKTQFSGNLLFYYLCAIYVLLSSNEFKLCKSNDIHYNIADPECTGPFGLCTQEDKDTLGYLAIKKLHSKMDEDSDGQVEVQETKEFIREELQIKNGAIYSEKQKKFHGNDLLISVDEMWKSWKYSQAYNWTTENLIVWLNDHVKLPQYVDNFRRNRIDGQFLPRLAVNENNYYANVMQIKDPRHKRLIMIKATDLILFGPQHKPHNLIKDVLMISALTMSIFICIYLYTKHRQSLEQIKKMLAEFEKLGDIDESNLVSQIKHNISVSSSLFSFNLRKNSDPQQQETCAANGMTKSDSITRLKQRRENQLMSEKNAKLTQELNIVKQEADHLRRAREGADGQLAQLRLAEQELDKVRNALKQTETRLELVKYQPPVNLINLLNRTYESEKELLDYKFKLIDKEKDACVDSLKKVCKRQSGLLGALKIAHSSTLEDIQHKLEILTRELKKLHSEKHEMHKRWTNIFDLCNKDAVNLPTSSFDNGSQEIPDDTNDEQFETNASNGKATFVHSNSVVTITNNQNNNNNSNISRPKLVQNKLSIDNFYDLDSNVTNGKPKEELVLKHDDSNNNNLGLANLNEKTNNKLQTIIQPANKSPSFIVKITPPPQADSTTTIVTSPKVQRIARESLIHKNDVFQFDDVDSVKTSDMFFKSTPQSSFESDDTCKSSLKNGNTESSNKLERKVTSSFRKRNGFFGSSSSSKLKKSTTSSKIDDSQQEQNQPQTKLERSNTFTRHLSSLRKMFNSKQNIKAVSQTNIAAVSLAPPEIKEINNEVKASVQSIPVIINSTSNKQLTISVNNRSKQDENNITNQMNETNETKMGKFDLISIPTSNSNTSFTIRSRSNENVNHNSSETNLNQTVNGTSTKIENTLVEENKKLEKKSSKIFNLKFKTKKNKTKN